MKDALTPLSDMLKEKQIRMSHQRVKVLEYLASHPCHPTAEMVLTFLQKELPTLSKSTVYKTLNAFVDAKIIREITIEDNEIRYEYNLTDHGHFKCVDCGRIYDFPIDLSGLFCDELKGFVVQEKNVYFKGFCKSCYDEKSRLNQNK